MSLRVSSDEIRAYVSAQVKNAKQELPEESRRVVLRMPVDSVDITPQARALQKGHLRVRMEENGRYAEVTNSNSNPMMRLFDKGMSDVKQTLDEMRELTELMEDESVSVEDRYGTQMKLVELEGELEKKIYTLNEKYKELVNKLDMPVADGSTWSAKGQPSMEDFARAGKVRDLDEHYIADRTTNEIFAYRNFSAMIDKRTELRKEAIERVYMREHDPDAFAEYEEKLRKALREEYDNLVDDNGLWGTMDAQDLRGTTFPTNKPDGPEAGGSLQVETDVALSGDMVTSPDTILGDWMEFEREKYVEERLAGIEKADYEELNAMRVSVMSASLARESGDFLENLTNKLTEQFQRFAAQNELIGEEDPSLEPADIMKSRGQLGQIAQIAKATMIFLRDHLLFGGIQKDATREAKENYNVKREKTVPQGDGVRDIFAEVTTPMSEIWQMFRPDLFAEEDGSKHS